MVEKAQIKILDDTGDETEIIDVMFNPEDYTVSIIGRVNPDEGQESSPSFNKVDIVDFIVKSFFDTYETQSDVREKTNKIAKLLMPAVEGPDRNRPPICLFVWGKFTYKGIIHKLDQKFTMFLETGIPVRAELTFTFKSVATPQEYAEYMGIEACRKVWTIKSSDRLDLIAHKALKNAALWRKIADENNIDDPIAFPQTHDIGKTLVIPD
ncbi:MAG: peptidoglycan-binding protein LysM [ANME-2 cluster archaeon]|nr:peptidoglycan-binding protein LysM [ANME-2 cluster archaeon]MBC2700852.1 peptidoglycan-binding protein LysM [ANME-2 cluster archaeon]MBC2709317.1 peptidoglycan-binding protein LysM [ANME-2 cluster archaeon]MBC2746846.1 peptidoglycan-binding protein LysM [ANME-2 cluster archaeon]